jgi:hypothetical protein
MNHAWVYGERENITTIFGDHILMDRGGKIDEARNTKCGLKKLNPKTLQITTKK